MLNYDNSEQRRVVEQCYRTSKTLVNPISDFTDEDVWEFIRAYKLETCPLYAEGWKRMGCIGCPMGNRKVQEKQFERWPHMRRYYLSAFSEMLRIRAEKGLTNRMNWETDEDVMRWWLSHNSGSKKQHDGQLSLEDLGGMI